MQHLTVKKIWYHRKIHINKKLQPYKSVVKPILLYNSGTWELTKKEQNEIDVTHRRQPRTLINSKEICNNKLYKKCKEEEISVAIKRNKCKTFGHILRLPLYTPANESMNYYFKVPEKIRKYQGITRTTLPTFIDKDIKQTVKKNHLTVLPIKQFISTKGLENIRILAEERCIERLFKRYMFHLRRVKKHFYKSKMHKRRQLL